MDEILKSMGTEDFVGIVNILDSNKKSIGTGFFVSANGYILTCNHVYTEAKPTNNTIFFKYANPETTHVATFVASYCDIVLLSYSKVPPKKYYTIKGNGEIGDKLKTLGFPNGSFVDVEADPIFQHYTESRNLIQLENANTITNGFSGAPLINEEGFVIGMVSCNPRDENSRLENITFAIPSQEIINAFHEYLNDSEKQTQITDSLSGREREQKYLTLLIDECQSYLDRIGVINLSGEVTKYSGSINPIDNRLISRGVRMIQRYEVEKDNEKKIVDDIWDCIKRETQKVILLGEPGSGKTVSSIKLALDYAKLALVDSRELIPIFIPLGSFKDDKSFEEHIASEYLFGIADPKDYTFDKERFLLIFDAFNELESSKKDAVVEYIKNLKRFVVSCRSLDYETDFSKTKNLTKVNILDLDPTQIHQYIYGYLDHISAKSLWATLGGSETLLKFWEKEPMWFWHLPKSIDPLIIDKLCTTLLETKAWEEMHNKGLLPICRSPLLLNIICEIFDKDKKELPKNNGTLFRKFVDHCLNAELKKKIDVKELNEVSADSLKVIACNIMSHLAEAIITDKQGTGIQITRGRDFIKKHFEDEQITVCEKLLQGAKLLHIDDKEIRFFHQLLQEYFASKFLNDAFNKKDLAKRFFDQQTWWNPNGWEEPAVILVGTIYSDIGITKVNEYLLWLSEAQPNLVVRCVERGGVAALDMSTLDEDTRHKLQEKLIFRLEGLEDSLQSKIEIGRALGRFSDFRDGVGNKVYNGKELPNIKWIVHPQQANLKIAKYPITVKQFFAFISASDGYQAREAWLFAKEATSWYNNNQSKKRERQWSMEYLKLHSNEPVVNVSWIEAEAFCSWLSKKTNKSIHMPTENEWKKFRILTDSDTQNVDDCTLKELSPVGLLVEENSNNVVSDFGLVWEWCDDICDEDKTSQIPTRILKGGSWRYDTKYQSESYRFRTYPSFARDDIGFRIIMKENQTVNKENKY